MLDKILTKIGNFSYRFRYYIFGFALLLFIAVCIIQSFAGVSYSYSDYNKVIEVFPEEDSLVVVYDNKDEEKIGQIIEYLSQDEHVTSINAYSNTLGAKMNYAQASSLIGMDESFIKALFYAFGSDNAKTDAMTLVDAVNYIPTVLSSFGIQDEQYATTIAFYQEIINGIAEEKTYDKTAMQSMFSLDSEVVETVYLSVGVEQMTVADFVGFLENAEGVNQTVKEQISAINRLIDAVIEDNTFTASQLSQLFEKEGLTEELVSILYATYFANGVDLTNTQLSTYDFMVSVYNLASGPLSQMMTREQRFTLNLAYSKMASGKEQLVGEDYSRMILTIDYPLESKQMYDFYSALESKLDKSLDGEYYLVGNSAMSNELSKTFRKEYLMISIITAIAIFTVVFLAFRKFSVPLMLICIIQCAVFITMSAMAVAKVDMYFIALIIVQCILMGSMVDYGILLTNYYIEVRKDYEKEEAIPELLKRSIRAIAMSAIIMITVTFACGLMMKGAVASILLTLCVGSVSALVLVVFVLPSLLAIFDKSVLRTNKKSQEKV